MKAQLPYQIYIYIYQEQESEMIYRYESTDKMYQGKWKSKKPREIEVEADV